MARPLRFVPAGSLVEITTRTIQGRLLLTPSPEVTDIILGVIGKAQDLYKKTIHAFVVVGTHAHFLLSPANISGDPGESPSAFPSARSYCGGQGSPALGEDLRPTSAARQEDTGTTHAKDVRWPSRRAVRVSARVESEDSTAVGLLRYLAPRRPRRAGQQTAWQRKVDPGKPI